MFWRRHLATELGNRPTELELYFFGLFIACLLCMIFMFLILHVINRQIYSECVNEDISFNLRVLNSQIQLLIYWLWLTDYIFFHSEIQANSLIQDFNSGTGGHLESQHRGHLVDECETKLECELNWRTLVLRNVSKTGRRANIKHTELNNPFLYRGSLYESPE